MRADIIEFRDSVEVKTHTDSVIIDLVFKSHQDIIPSCNPVSLHTATSVDGLSQQNYNAA